MCLISISAAGRPFRRFASAVVVRIVLGVVLTTSQPIAFQPAVRDPAHPSSTVLEVQKNQTPAPADVAAPMSGPIAAEPGPGWG